MSAVKVKQMKQLKIYVSPQSFTCRIKKKKNRWVVEKPRNSARLVTNPLIKRKTGINAHSNWPNKVRGDTVTWTLGPDAKEAHFQFPPKLFKNLPRKKARLNRHMVAHIRGAGNKLTLKLHPGADRRHNPYYYAVYVVDKRGNGKFANGGNPPAEINVGP